MKTIMHQFICILAVLALFSSCDKDKEKEVILEENYEMTVIVKYVKQSKEYFDSGSRVYIYFNKDLFDFTAVQYDGDGIYSSSDKIIEPDEKYVVNKDGLVAINFNGRSDIEFTMLVESQKMSQRMFMSFERYNFSSTHKFIFNDFEDD